MKKGIVTKKLKSILSAALVGVMAASLLAGCGKIGGKDEPGTNNSTAELSETVFIPEYTSLDIMETDFVSYDSWGAKVKGNSVYMTKTVMNTKKDNIEDSFLCEFDLSTGKLVNEISIFSAFSEYADATDYIPEKYKETASHGVNVNYFDIFEDGNIVTIANQYWYDEASQEYGNKYLIAFLDKEGTILKNFEFDLSSLFNSDRTYPQSVVTVGDKVVIFVAEYKEDVTGYGVLSYTSDGEQLGAAPLDIQQVSSTFVTSTGKLLVSTYDSNWTTHLAEFDPVNLTFGNEFQNLPNDSINSIGKVEGDDDNIVLADYEKVYEYSLSKKELSEIFKFTDADMSAGNIISVNKDADGSYVILNMNYNADPARLEIIRVTEKNRSEVGDRTELVVASLYEDYDLQQMIIEFNKTHPGIHLNMKSYYDWENQDSDIEDAKKRMVNDLTSGTNAPDLINLENLNFVEYAKQGMFVDLTPYLENSSVISLDDFEQNIVQKFRTNDILVAIPYSFSLRTFFVSSKTWGDKNSWTVDEMIDFDKAHPEGTLSDYASRMEIMDICLYSNMDYFVNWETGECKFDTDVFKKILEYVATYPKEIDWEAVEGDTTSETEKIANGKILCESGWIDGLEEIQLYRDYLFAGNATIVGYPSVEGESRAYIEPESSYGICTASANKDAAWEFVEFVLSQPAGNNMYQLPTNKNELQKLVDKELEGKGAKTGSSVGWGNGEIYDYHYATQEDIDIFFDMLANAKIESNDKGEIEKIIEEETAGFFEGAKSVDDTAKIIQSRVNLYVQENR
jgi:ABC-type glycerol-3-phosphate transport system substrate-binding protein